MVGGVDTQQRALPGSAGQDRYRDRGRGLWRPVDGAGAAPQRRRRRRAGARRFRRRRLDAQRRHDLGRHQSRQGPGRQEPDRRGVRAQEGRADGRRRRFAHRAGGHHRPRRHRVRAAQERPLRRRLDAQALRRSRDQGRDLQQIRQCRQLDGAARTPARDDRLGLLLRRHACHPRRPSPSRALLQGPARSRAPRGRDPVRQCRGRAHREDRDRLAGADLERAGRVPRGRGRHQRLYRRPDAPAEAPRRAGGEPHHRHGGSCPSMPAS